MSFVNALLKNMVLICYLSAVFIYYTHPDHFPFQVHGREGFNANTLGFGRGGRAEPPYRGRARLS